MEEEEEENEVIGSARTAGVYLEAASSEFVSVFVHSKTICTKTIRSGNVIDGTH